MHVALPGGTASSHMCSSSACVRKYCADGRCRSRPLPQPASVPRGASCSSFMAHHIWPLHLHTSLASFLLNQQTMVLPACVVLVRKILHRRLLPQPAYLQRGASF